MDPTFFATPDDFRRWLEEHHETASELWVGLWKKGTGKPSLTWDESVDEALSFGWIDGVRKSVDHEGYAIRFTPRKPGSIWSAKNSRRMEELIAAGRVQPAGMRAYEARDPERSALYSFDRRTEARFDPGLEARFRENPAAWEFFQAQPPGYRRTATHWVTSAKREETRSRRLDTLIEDSAAGRRIGLLRR